jgi:uncharacterized protein (TIGR00730 family)
VAVYCASADAAVPRYGAAVAAVGRGLAERGIGIVFGGGRVGLMGALADAALAAGGEVIGVIPEKLMTLELGHGGCTRLEVVQTMHERKARMADLSDAFLALPGGWGTWEELFEVVTWTQLGYHRKPVGVLDVDGFYAPLRQMVGAALEQGFIRPAVGEILSFDDDLGRLLDTMARADLPDLERWLTP